MAVFPKELSSIYRTATTHDIHSWSFGAISVISTPNAGNWRAATRTLNDEAIFGPTVDYRCACGKYSGKDFERMVCDHCGVKITTSASRRVRFGHIDLPKPTEHPFGGSTLQLDAFPVLPAALRASEAGIEVNGLYEDLLRSLNPLDSKAAFRAVEAIVLTILPVLVEATRWDLDEAHILAHGIALLRHQSSDGR